MSAKNSGRFSIMPARAIDDKRLGLAALKVLAALGTYGDRDGWCWPSVSTIADRIGVKRQSVQSQINRLIELGYVEKLERFDENGGQKSNLYRIIFDIPAASEFAPPAALEAALPAALEAAQTLTVNDTVNDLIRETSQDSEFENLSFEDRAFWENKERERKERQSPQMRLPRTSEDVRSEAEQAIMGYYNNREKNHAFVLENKIDLSFVPEELLPLARATCAIIKRGPTTQEQSFWIKEWRNQIEMGLTPHDLEKAAERMREDELMIKSPKSLNAYAWDDHANCVSEAPTKPQFSQKAMQFMRQQQKTHGGT